MFSHSVHSSTAFKYYRIIDDTYDVFSFVTTTYEDGSVRTFRNWVGNFATEEEAIETIKRLDG